MHPVQKEFGHSPVAHPIMEALALAPLSASQIKVVLTVIRETYGWSRKSAPISHQFFHERTGLHRDTVKSVVKGLVSEGVLILEERASFSNAAVYSLQKDPRQWGKFAVTPSTLDQGHTAPPGGLQTPTPGGLQTPTPGGLQTPSDAMQPQESQRVAEAENNRKQVKSNHLSIQPGREADETGDDVSRGTTTQGDVIPLPVPYQGEPMTDAEFIRHVVALANRGMRENPNLGEYVTPILASAGDSQQAVIDWIAEGIPRSVIERTVYDRAKSYRPRGHRKRITGMAYFTGAVRDAAELAKADEVRPPTETDGHAERRNSTGTESPFDESRYKFRYG